MMKKFGFGCIALLLALASAPLSGQTLDQFKRQAAQADPSYNSRVVATEHGSAATVVHSMQAQPSGTKIPGYRVRIFLDNGQNARASANGAIARFREIYPDIPAYLSYENPYFKVTVGNCLTSEEAIILLGKIRDAFDRAFLVREEISLSLFGETASSIPTSNGHFGAGNLIRHSLIPAVFCGSIRTRRHNSRTGRNTASAYNKRKKKTSFANPRARKSIFQ